MSLPKQLKIGTRGSPLALWQANWVASQIRAKAPETQVDLIQVVTSGDRLKDVSLKDQGGKGLFVKEIEEQLLEGRIDLAVHSVKDVPGKLPKGLLLSAILERADPRDAFLSRVATSLKDLPQGATVGTSSPRRMVQLKQMRPDLHIVEYRGNVETRMRKMEAGEVDATILAVAGLERLGLTDHICDYFKIEEMIPAIGQGAVGIETRHDNADLNVWLQENIHHRETGLCVAAERALLLAIEGDCHTPVAGHAQLHRDELHMWACYATPTGERVVHVESEGRALSPERLGEHVAQELQCQL
ncbi:MAG: hydroxymethylbilane synthase [Deltaproteobacteria bacterium CG11_big_fil_rev_8_21_14_0_20_47_16]|nr:MAG: hydroxymethylbilane synthase [Deltaproteobacteria bacterium CG11_big_fil_rev_8_21_14_0_20_47_16]